MCVLDRPSLAPPCGKANPHLLSNSENSGSCKRRVHELLGLVGSLNWLEIEAISHRGESLFFEIWHKTTIIPFVKLLRPRASPRGRETGRLFRPSVASSKNLVGMSVFVRRWPRSKFSLVCQCSFVRPTITSRSSPYYDFVTFGTFINLQTGAVACNWVMENRSLTLYVL